MLINESAGGAGEPEDVIEGEEGDNDESDDSSQQPDPLDAIEDEATRNEMKALRAKDRRLKAKPPVDTPPVSPSPFATKDDLKMLATNDAKKLVAPEVKELWNELVGIPLGGYNPMDSESIAENMNKRYQLYLLDNPQGETDPTKVFTQSPNTPPGGGGGKPPKQPDARPLPGFKEATQPADWYPPTK